MKTTAALGPPRSPGLPLPRPGLVARLFALDVRTLAVFRIALALVLLADLAIRYTDLTTMYVGDGMFPRDQIRLRYTSAWNWSLHFFADTAGFQTALFGLATFAATALLVGWQTRLAAIVS